ncbi:MAG TPA: hypothetical protein VEC57_04170 [Candidatus Limnocylindrales bacterium]|nr:hypothetical protein [Candidatus Limnocylindrales bacterium]
MAPPPAAAAPVPAPGSPEAAAEGARLREEGLRLRARIKVEEALAVLKQAVAVDPSAENHAAYGRLLRDLTVIDKALYHLRAAAEADPRNADRWIELANAYYLKPDPGLAWQAEKRAREAEPGLQLRRTRGQLERADDSTAPAQ